MIKFSVGSDEKRKKEITEKQKISVFRFFSFLVGILSLCVFVQGYLFGAEDILFPNAAGAFYPDNPTELSRMIDQYLGNADPAAVEGEIFALISPHAGYGFSGQVAAFGYKLIKNKPYKTVVVLGPSHFFAMDGVSVYSGGTFRTPLGDLEVDKDFTQKLLNYDKEVFFEPRAFEKEHSVEVQLPFLQKTLSGFKIVPVVMGNCSIEACRKFAQALRQAIGERKDVLVVASSDMYHGYDYQEALNTDKLTLSFLEAMNIQGLYFSVLENKAELCGIFPVVTTLMLAQELGHRKLQVLEYTNSAEVTGNKTKGNWIVGYTSCVIDAPTAPSVNGERPSTSLRTALSERSESNGRSRTIVKEKSILKDEKEKLMLNKEQRKKLLALARKSIETYLKTGKKEELSESDPLLTKELGAFVTLHKDGELRGCIGSLIGKEPLYLTIRDMAIESATGDPRFPALELPELKNLEIEISVLSVMERVDSPDKIQLGKHGVLVRRGFNSGVFLPQVATETGWTKEEFLSNLCAHKAGLKPDAWKDKVTEIYIFSAEVFSEKEIVSGE